MGDRESRRSPAARRPATCRRTAGRRLPAYLVGDVDLVTVAVALADPRGAVDFRDAALRIEHRLIGAEPHRAAEIAARLALLDFVAAHPFGHQPDNRMRARA